MYIYIYILHCIIVPCTIVFKIVYVVRCIVAACSIARHSRVDCQSPGSRNSNTLKPPCHILPPSEIPWRLFLAVLQAQEGNTYFTELAERVEYGKYVKGSVQTLPARAPPRPTKPASGGRTGSIYIYIYI